jgi:hypothetical protein
MPPSFSSTTPLAFSALPRLLGVALSLALLSSRAAVVAGEPTIEVFTDDTTLAPVSVGKLWDGSCRGLTNCQNDCRSIFYKVTGGSASITATSCGASAYPQRLYVWAGTGSACSTFTCASAYPTRLFVCVHGPSRVRPCRAILLETDPRLCPCSSRPRLAGPQRPTAAGATILEKMTVATTTSFRPGPASRGSR